ncbi:MAG: hypothetical protein IT324_27635 [Anaerolineae bacterium]|nr:hypothetical protein [Anaerolineae bacterium]
MRKHNLLLIAAIVLIALLMLATSLTLLPAAPAVPTPTWPLGIELPNKLPRIQP